MKEFMPRVFSERKGVVKSSKNCTGLLLGLGCARRIRKCEYEGEDMKTVFWEV